MHEPDTRKGDLNMAAKPLSDCARRTVEIHAQREAKLRGSDRVEPIDILLGMTQEESGTSAQATFADRGKSLDDVRTAAEAVADNFGRSAFTGILPLSDETQELLITAEHESRKRVHTVGLLLGMLAL